MTFESMLAKMGTGAKQAVDRYAEYGAPVQEQQYFYTYESQPESHHEASSKHTHSGGHKGHAAMSALTLLAFLFFLHILQQCIKEHMDAMATPQITIMAASRESDTALRNVDEKIDKTGVTVQLDKENDAANRDDDKQLMKINTATPPRYSHNHNAIKKYGERIANDQL